MDSKPFFLSKINWAGIVLFLAGVGAFADKLPPTWAKYVLAIGGIFTIIARTFYTSTTISGVGPTNG